MRRPARIIVCLAAVWAAFRFGLPPIASRIARRWLDLGQPGSSTCRVSRLNPFRLSASAIRIGAVPSTPEIDSIDIRFTPWGLLSGNVSSLHVSGSANLGEALGERALKCVPDPATSFSFDMERWPDSGYRGTLRGRILGGPLSGALTGKTLRSASLDLSWTPAFDGMELPVLRIAASALSEPGTNGTAEVSARASANLEGCTWHIGAYARAGAEGFEIDAELPDGAFELDDPLVRPLVDALAPEGLAMSALSFNLTGTVHCAKAPSDPVPRWSVGGRASGFNASGTSKGTAFSVSGGRCWLPIEGFGGHFDIKPFGVLFDSADIGNLSLTRGAFWFRPDLETLLLSEGSVGFCGGTARVYALHLNYERLDAGFTLMIDDIDAGEILTMFPGVRGKASGRLYGKVPISLREGHQIRLRNAFLYSPPGQIGRIEIEDASLLTENLLAAGVPEQTCLDLERALHSLDYTAARMELSQNRDTGLGRLSIALEGSSKDGPAEIPVKLELNFNGELQDMLNIGISAATAK